MPDGSMIHVYRDHTGQHRIVAFKSLAHSVGFAGLLIDVCGCIVRGEVAQGFVEAHSLPMLYAFGLGMGLKIFSEKGLTAGA